MFKDLISVIGIISILYKLVTHKGPISEDRMANMLGLVAWFGVGLLHEFLSGFMVIFLSIVCMGISLVGMYFMLKNDEFESDKVEKYQSNFKVGVYAWIFLVALYIYLYVLTYY